MRMRRILAFVMALILTCSTFGSASITGYAAPTDGVDNETATVTVEDTEESSADVADGDAIVVESSEDESAESGTDVVEDSEEPSGEVSDEEGSTEETTTEVNEELTTEVVSEEVTIEETTTEEMTTEVLLGEVDNMSVNALADDGVDYKSLAQINVQGGESYLIINQYYLDEAGVEANDSTLTNIINAYAQLDEVVDIVSITLFSAIDTVSEEVWDAAYNLLNTHAETEFPFLHIASNPDDASGDITWHFQNLEDASADINIGMSLTVGKPGEGWTVEFENTTFPAEFAEVNVCRYGDDEDYTSFREAMVIMTDTSEDAEGFICDADGNVIKDSYVKPVDMDSQEESRYYDATLGYIEDLKSNTPYRVRMPLAYTGTVDTWDDGTEELMIMLGDAGVESFTKQNLLDILAANEGEKYGSVYIQQPSTVTTVNGEVINAATGLLTKKDDIDSFVKFGFANGETKKCMDLCIVNPTGNESETDLAVSAALTVPADSESGDYPTVSFNIPEFASDRVDVWFGTGKDTDDGKTLIALFGSDDRKLEISGTDTWVDYNVDDYNVCFYIGNVDNLTNNTSYEIQKYVYKGIETEWDNGQGVIRHGLDICASHEDKESLTEQEILDAIAARKAMGQTFDEVYIESGYAESATLSGAVINAAVEILESDDDKILSFGFADGEKQIRYSLFNTTGTNAESIDVSASISVPASATSSDGVSFSKNIDSSVLGTEHANIQFGFDNKTAQAAVLQKLFGDGENLLSISDAEAKAIYIKTEDSTMIIVEDVCSLTNEQEYSLSDMSYRGEVISEDDMTKLYIDWHGFEEVLDEWSVQAIVDAINSYGEEKFTEIEIVLPGETRSNVTVYSKIYNAAVKKLNEESHGIWYRNDMVDYCITYHFANPQAVTLSKDVQIKNEMYINEYDRPAMKFDFPAALSKVYTNLYMELNLEDEITQEYINRLDDGTENSLYALYPTEVARLSFDWEAMYEDESCENQIGIEASLIGMNYMKANKEYVINPWFIGHVREEVWDAGTKDEKTVRILDINANEYGYKTFSASLLNEYLEEWEWAIEGAEDDSFHQEPFNVINIQQTATTKNVISKDNFNLARTLLVDDGYTEINYTFDSSVNEQIGDTEEWNWYQNQVNWSFPNPSEATKDMTVGLTFAPKGEDGLKLKMLANTYPASGVNASYSVDAEYFTTADEFSWAIGDAPVPEEDYRHIGILSNVANLTLTNSDAWQRSYINGEDKTVMQFNIDNAQNLPATECTAVPIGWGEEFYIGQEGLNFIPNMVMKPGTKATWKSFDTNIANFSGNTLTLLNEGTFLYAASFKNTNGAQVAEIYEANVTTKLLDVDFVNVDKTVSGNNILTMTMNPEEDKQYFENPDDWYPRAYLDLRFYPDRAGVDPSSWEWNIDGDEGVIELLNNHEYEGNWYPNGEIKALKPGTVAISVKCKDGDSYLTDEKGEVLIASCTVTVKPAVYDLIDWENLFAETDFTAAWDENEYGHVVAVTNYDKTLADIELPDGFAWKTPSTSLAAFPNVEMFSFPAVYTAEDGRTAEVMLNVGFVRIDGISLWGAIADDGWIDSGAVIEDGTTLEFYYSLDVWNSYMLWPDGVILEDMNALLASKGDSRVLSLQYDSALEMDENGVHFTADKAKGGKKNFKVSLMELDTAKKNAKAKAIKTGSFTVTVAKKDIADFSQMYIGKGIQEGYEAFEGMIGEKGTFYFGLPKDSGFKLTVKNLDTTVSKWGRITYKDIVLDEWNGNTDVTYYVACVPYEIIGEGNVAYSLTANDEVKTSVSRTAAVYYRDYLPKMQATKLTIDKNWNATVAGLPIQMDIDTYFGDSNDSNAFFTTDNFDITLVNEDERERVMVSFKDGVDVKKGNYKISLDVPVTTPLTDNEGNAKVITWPLQLTVTVTDKLPTLTVKQTEKVNLFYTDEEGDGAFTITGSAEIASVTLKPQKDGNELDYTLDEQTYAIQKKDGTTGKNNKATIVAYFDGYTKPVEKKVTIATVNKAPTLVLSSKSDTYYTQYSRGDDLNTYLTFTDKTTGEFYENLSSIMVMGDLENTELPSNQGDLFSFVTKKNKNAYGLGKDASGITLVLEDAENAKKSTDKFTFYVKEANWAQAVKVSYSIKVDTTIPKLELSSKNVTINKNDALYSQQVALTQLSLKGSDRDLLTDDYNGYWVSFSGADAKANQYLNTVLILEQHNDNLRIRLNRNDIPKGSYKYNVNLHADDLQTLTTQITVKVVDEAPAKCITVSAKGSIDVLDRAGTAVTYTAKLKNVQGEIVGAELRGTDAGLFEGTFDVEDGKLVVKAHDWAGYSTKHTYKITPVFFVRSEDFGEVELEGKEQSIKVKQGKPKLTVTADVSNILYRNRTNEVTIDLDALLNKTTDVKIVGIEPLNYAGTFDYYLIDESGNVIEENGEMKYVEEIRIKGNDYPQEIIASGKTVTLQFNVYYEGMAVNEKPIKTTFKMVVK